MVVSASRTHKAHDGKPSPREIKAARQQNRYYEDPQGRRCNVPAIVVRFQITRDLFTKYQRDGWPALDGKSLDEFPESLGDYGRHERTFRIDDVARVLREPLQGPLAPGWLDESTYRDAEGEWVTVNWCRRWRLPANSLIRWSAGRRAGGQWQSSGCRYLEDGRAIGHQWVTPARLRNADKVLVLFKEDVSAIKVARDNRRSKTARKGIGHVFKDEQGSWLTGSQFKQLYPDVSLGFLDYWKKRRSTLRAGQVALRSNLIPSRQQPDGPIRVLGFLQEDIDTILRGGESKHLNTGRQGIRGAKLKAKLDGDAKRFLQKLLQERGPLSSNAVLAEAEAAGFCRSRVYRVKAAAKITVSKLGEGFAFWRLSSERPPQTDAGKATAFLRDLLKDGAVSVQESVAAAQAAGIKPYSLLLARKDLGLEPCLKDGVWIWRKPPKQYEDQVAEKFLKAALKDGPVPSRQLFADAARAGITPHFLSKAKISLEIESRHRKDQPWYWCWVGQQLPLPDFVGASNDTITEQEVMAGAASDRNGNSLSTDSELERMSTVSYAVHVTNRQDEPLPVRHDEEHYARTKEVIADGVVEALRRTARDQPSSAIAQVCPTPRKLKDRVHVDSASKNVTIDNVPHEIPHPGAFNFVRALVEKHGELVPSKEIRKLPCCKTRLDLLLKEHVPEALHQFIKSKPGKGGGYWLILPSLQESAQSSAIDT